MIDVSWEFGIQNAERRMQGGTVLVTAQPSLVDQAYEALLGEIADGTLAAGTRLVQEPLAARYGVSRQPIQQALLLLRSDGVVREAGRRGLVVAPLDMTMMRDRYQVRAVLDALAASLAAHRCAASPGEAARTRRAGERIVTQGLAAAATGARRALIAHDVAFHAFVYAASGNPMIAPSAEVHWRFLRRAMGEVLHTSEPATLWREHRTVLEAILAGDAARAGHHSRAHVQDAAARLAAEAVDEAVTGPAGPVRRAPGRAATSDRPPARGPGPCRDAVSRGHGRSARERASGDG